MTSDLITPRLQRTTAVGVSVFFACMFAIPSGYSYGGGILLLAGLWMLACHTRPALERLDRALIATFLAYGLVTISMTLWLHNSSGEVDRAARALLMVPVFLLLLRVPVRLQWIWLAMIVGVVLSALLAWYQLNVLHMGRAPGFQDEIHFSNVALVFVAFCAAGLLWSKTQGKRANAWRLAFVVGMCCGLYSSIAGGSRGSWLAVPAIFAVFAVALLNRRNWMRALGIFAVFVAVVAALFVMPESTIRTRYQEAEQDLAQYQQNNADTSAGARLAMWQGAFINLAQRPVLGWNMDEFNAALEPAIEAGKVSKVAVQFHGNLHNNYLQAWAFAGLPGLLVVLLLYGLPLWFFVPYLRDRDPAVQALAICGTVLVTSYWCFSLTHVILGRNNTIMFFLLVLSTLWAALRHARAAAR